MLLNVLYKSNEKKNEKKKKPSTVCEILLESSVLNKKKTVLMLQLYKTVNNFTRVSKRPYTFQFFFFFSFLFQFRLSLFYICRFRKTLLSVEIKETITLIYNEILCNLSKFKIFFCFVLSIHIISAHPISLF